MEERIAPYLRSVGNRWTRPGDPTGDQMLNGIAPVAENAVPAAVLVPIVARPNAEPTVLLTRRSDALRAHAGQVSFPGGRAEPDDDGPVATALREAHEEVGLEPASVTVLGLLDGYRTGTRFLVTPVVGLVRQPFTPRSDPGEVAETFEVPLAFFLDGSNHAIESRPWNRARRYYYAFRWDGRLIWGATAGMLVHLARRMRGEPR